MGWRLGQALVVASAMKMRKRVKSRGPSSRAVLGAVTTERGAMKGSITS